MTGKGIATYEYKNDYFYIIIRETPEIAPGSHVLCCGINMSRFDPICWGKAGICSNPAFKGLQQLRADISAYAQKTGKRTRSAGQFPCGPITPPVGTGWYRETPLLIERAAPIEIRKMLDFSARDLVRTVLTVCAPDARVPAKLPASAEMQKFLDALNIKNFREAAPSPISKPNGSKSDARDH
ncbi:MAG: hypothetical protein OEW15_00955 [Nitrospirota bacterium]|nr:hypothetical protein [Nitrospirota bacterium]